MDYISKYHSYLENEKRFSLHTVRAYTDDLSAFRNFCIQEFEVQHLAEADHSIIRTWVVSLMEKGNDPKTVRRKLSCLNSFYRFLMKCGEIRSNPVRKVIAPKTKKRLPVFVEESKMEKLFSDEIFPQDIFGIRDKTMLELFYATGIRRSELIGLKLSDVSNDRIKVLGKRNKQRIIPLTHEIRLQIDRYIKIRTELLGESDSDHLLLDNKGNKLSPQFVYRKVNEYLSKVTSLEKKSPHVIRHTFATHLLNNGADLNAIKELLGHSSLAATQVYTHNTIEKLKNIYHQSHPLAG